MTYFQSLFDKTCDYAMQNLDYVEQTVSQDQNASLVAPFSHDEFTKAIMQMSLDWTVSTPLSSSVFGLYLVTTSSKLVHHGYQIEHLMSTLIK